MLQRQTRGGVALAGLLMGLPTTPAFATVMEYSEEGQAKVRPSLNYLQRAKLLARDGTAHATAGLNGKVDTGWIDPVQETEQMPLAVVLPEVTPKVTVTMPIVATPEPEWIEVELAALPDSLVGTDMPDTLPIPSGDEMPDAPDIDDALEDDGDDILETQNEAVIPTLLQEAMTIVPVQKKQRHGMDEPQDETLDVFPHLDAEPLAQIAGEIALSHDIPPALFVALIEAESGFDIDAVSVKGAVGLTQLMPGTAEDLGVDPEDPLENMTGGARYLAAQYKRFGAWDLALAAYNAGPARVARSGGIPDFPETRAFIARVLGTASKARTRFAGAL